MDFSDKNSFFVLSYPYIEETWHKQKGGSQKTELHLSSC